MAGSKDHRHLLKHPVITSFLCLKWSKLSSHYNSNLAFYSLLGMYGHKELFLKFYAELCKTLDKFFCSCMKLVILIKQKSKVLTSSPSLQPKICTRVYTSVADPVCFSRIPDPTFFHPDPGSASNNLSILTQKCGF
jgi:hypothetical protein